MTSKNPNPFTWLSLVFIIATLLIIFPKIDCKIIYLGPSTDSGNWNGTCAANCSEGSPCIPPANQSVVNSADVICELILVGGNWLNFDWKNTVNYDRNNTKVTFAAGFNSSYGSQMKLEVPQGLEVVHHGLSYFSLAITAGSRVSISSGDRQNVWSNSTLLITPSDCGAIDAYFGVFSMHNLKISFGSASRIRLDLFKLTATTDAAVKYPLFNQLDSANTGRNYLPGLCSDSASPPSAPLDPYIYITDCNISNFEMVTSLPHAALGTVKIVRSEISNIHRPIIKADATSEISLLILDNSNISAQTGSLQLATTNVSLEIHKSTVSGLLLDSLTRLHAFDSLIRDSIIHTGHETSLELSDSTVLCTFNQSFTIEMPNPNITNVNISGCYVHINTSAAFSATTNLRIDQLSLGSSANVSIPRFTVTESIKCDNCTESFPVVSAPLDGPSEWTFYPITVTDIHINLSSPNVLNLHANNTDIGLVGEGKTHFGTCPDHINLFWNIPIPSNYTLIKPISAPLGNISLNVTTEQQAAFEAHLSHEGETLYCSVLPKLNPPLLPPTLLPPPSMPCIGPIPAGFGCNDGVLTFMGSLEVPSVSFPPGAGTIVVIGNLSVSETVVFRGIGSSLNVTGCASIKEIEIDVSDDPNQHNPKTVPKGSVLLVQQGSGCSNSLIDTKVTIKQEKSCKSINSRNESDNRQLSVIFTLDTKKCNDKWIILGSVLGGALLLVVILMLVFTFNKRARHCIRPSSRRGKPPAP